MLMATAQTQYVTSQYNPFSVETIKELGSWYALLVQSGRERRICDWLHIRQYEVYWPRFESLVKLNRHRRGKRYRSVLPGYLFIFVPVGGELNCPLLEDYPHIRRIMRRASGEVVIVSAEDIDKIQNLETALQNEVAAAGNIPFRIGQIVSVRSLCGASCKILRIDNGKRIEVEANLFGGKRRAFVPVSDIEAI